MPLVALMWIAIFLFPVFAAVRAVQVCRDATDNESGSTGFLASIGMLGIVLTAIIGSIAAVSMAVLAIKGEGAGLGAMVVLMLLVIPYGISEILFHIGTD